MSKIEAIRLLGMMLQTATQKLSWSRSMGVHPKSLAYVQQQEEIDALTIAIQNLKGDK